MNMRMLKQDKVSAPTRAICRRLYNERLNPPHLQANLDRITSRVVADLAGQGIGTTRDSVVTCLLYLAQGDAIHADLERAVANAVNAR